MLINKTSWPKVSSIVLTNIQVLYKRDTYNTPPITIRITAKEIEEHVHSDNFILYM